MSGEQEDHNRCFAEGQEGHHVVTAIDIVKAYEKYRKALAGDRLTFKRVKADLHALCRAVKPKFKG